MTVRVSSIEVSPSTAFYLEADLLSQSVANNTSTVRCYLRANNGPSGNSSSWYGSSGTQTGQVDGVGTFAVHSGNPFLPSGYAQNAQRWMDGPYDVVVPHNADGTAPANLGGGNRGVIVRMLLSYSVSRNLTGSVVLPTIPRASTATFSPGSSFDAGSAVTINTNRASTSFTHDISYSFGALTGQTAGLAASTGVGASTTFTPPLALLAQIPNATSGSGVLTVVTKNGSTVIGTKTTAFTVKAGAGVVPTISSLSVTDDNPTVASIVGLFVQDLSLLKATVNAAGVQGSTITARSFTMGGTTVASGAVIPITGSGTVPVSAAATDSRGRVAAFSGSISALAYSPPLFTQVLVRRCTSGGVLDDNGIYLRVDLNCAVQSLVNSTQRNSLTIKVFTRPRGSSTWTARNVINHGSLTYNTNVLVSGGGNYPIDDSFDVRVEISDKFNTAAAQTVVATAAVFMHWSKTGVGIGKYHENGALDVAGAIFASGVDVRRAATDALTGVVELATNAEVQAGSDTVRAITPAGLASRTATDARTGIAELATQAEVNAGTDTSRIVTPATLKSSMALRPERIGLARTTTPDQTGINTTEVAVTGISVSVTLATAADLQFIVQLSSYSTAAPDVITIALKDGSTVVAEWLAPANSSPTITGTRRQQSFTGVLLAVASGSHTYTLTVRRVAGTGNITVAPRLLAPNFLMIDRFS